MTSTSLAKLGVLHGLDMLMALVAEPWLAGLSGCSLASFAFGPGCNCSLPMYGQGIVFVDGAKNNGVWRVGALAPFRGVRVSHPPFCPFASQQTTELHVIAWAVRLAVRLGE